MSTVDVTNLSKVHREHSSGSSIHDEKRSHDEEAVVEAEQEATYDDHDVYVFYTYLGLSSNL